MIENNNSNIAPVQQQATTKSILAARFDAIVNLIDSLRNVNKARKGITKGQFKTDCWERALKGTKSMTKKLRQALIFIVPSCPVNNSKGNSLISKEGH